VIASVEKDTNTEMRFQKVFSTVVGFCQTSDKSHYKRGRCKLWPVPPRIRKRMR